MWALLYILFLKRSPSQSKRHWIFFHFTIYRNIEIVRKKLFRILKILTVQYQRPNNIVYVISSIIHEFCNKQKRYDSLYTAYESYTQSARSHWNRHCLGLESLGIVYRICLKDSKWNFIKQSHFISIVKCHSINDRGTHLVICVIAHFFRISFSDVVIHSHYIRETLLSLTKR